MTRSKITGTKKNYALLSFNYKIYWEKNPICQILIEKVRELLIQGVSEKKILKAHSFL